jgi:toxin ParE1/3/4
VRTILLTPRAKADIDDIWSHSQAQWGEERTERYIRDLWRSAERLADDPRRGRPCDEIRPGYIRHAAGSHVIFARLHGDTLIVVRILHQRMDFDRHL